MNAAFTSVVATPDGATAGFANIGTLGTLLQLPSMAQPLTYGPTVTVPVGAIGSTAAPTCAWYDLQCKVTQANADAASTLKTAAGTLGLVLLAVVLVALGVWALIK